MHWLSQWHSKNPTRATAVLKTVQQGTRSFTRNVWSRVGIDPADHSHSIVLGGFELMS